MLWSAGKAVTQVGAGEVPVAKRRARWAGSALAGASTLAAGLLGGATNVFTGQLPPEWAFVQDPRVTGSATLLLLLVTVVLAVWAYRTSSDDPDGGSTAGASATPSVHIGGSTSGPVVVSAASTTSGPAVAGGSSPTLVGGGAGHVVYAEQGASVVLAPAPAPVPIPRPGRVVVGELPGVPPSMQDRAELDRLSELVKGGERVSVVCALGARGVGKTQLAAAVARRASEQWAWPLVAWTSGETTDALMSDLARVADRIGVADPDGDTSASARRLREHLNARNEPALLVVDNATDPDQLRRWLPTTGPTRVVVTSTELAVASLGRALEVGVFPRKQSIAYLHERTSRDDRIGADALAEELGDLPLALAQAASTMRLRGYSYQRYAQLLAEVDLDQALVRREGEHYPHGAAEAILLSLATLESLPRIGLSTLLERAALLSPNGIDRRLLTGLLPVGQVVDTRGGTNRGSADVDAALEVLVGASLLTWADIDGTAVILHRIIARVLRDRARGRGALAQLLTAVTASLEKQLAASSAWEDREYVDHLAGHVMVLWTLHLDEFHRGDLGFPQLARTLAVGTECARRLRSSGSPYRALAIGQQLQQTALEVVDGETLEVRDLVNNLAAALQDVGRLDEAIPLFEDNLATHRRLLGEDHPNTLASVNNLASALRAAGRLEEAIEQHQAALSAFQRLLGEDHPNTLASVNNLASALRAVGRFGEAIPLFEGNLATRRRVLGEDHPNTLASVDNLASALRAAGRPEEAIEQHQAALPAFQRLLGEDHPNTLASVNNLALALRAVGRFGEAIPLFEGNLATRRRVLGEDHPDTLGSVNNLASALRAAGRLEEAIPLFEGNLAARRRVLGEDHPNTLGSVNNLALALRAVGRLGEAIPLFEGNLAARRRVLGEDHPDTLASVDNLASALRAAGRPEEAIPLFEGNLAARRRVLGEDHPDTLSSINNLASTLEAAKRRPNS